MNNNVYRHKTKEGLNVLFLKKEGFAKVYAGIGVKYGSDNIEYIYHNRHHKSKNGIAHFIEHKLFRMEDGSDAFMSFSKMNANANAYTAPDKTIYHFSKIGESYDSLKLLITMYFTPVFEQEDIEREKDIIVSEINMYKDEPGYRFTTTSLKTLYPNEYFSKPIAGEEKDVRGIKAVDLKKAYEAFYTPENSYLVVVGDLKEEFLFSFIDEVMASLKITRKDTAIKYYKEKIKDPLKPKVICDKIGQDETEILIRLDDITNKDAISCEKIMGILDCIFSSSASFYKELEKKHLFTSEIDYHITTRVENSYISISAPTEKGRSFAKAVISKLQNLREDDLNDVILNNYFKYLKSKTVKKLDSVEGVGDTILSLALEDIDYFKSIEDILKLSKRDLLPVLKSITNGKMTYVICKAQNCEENA